ncbi:2-hydroxy-acid oxidase [Micromonospora sp. NBC_00421]|uniref:2-hydroxy-acid oxidase n=1 Tax=Micromonospora sp. NBC_00421 TaxID=2975976 RepID=UPI002E209389
MPAVPSTDLHLIRAARRAFTGPAGLMHDPAHREQSRHYLTDLARQDGREVPADLFDTASDSLGQSYAEMAEALIRALVGPDEPVDLLVLAFSRHDMLPGRATATYLSHVCPGTPLSFAVCDQGSAAAFSALRIAHAYASSAGCRRVLLIAVEQAVLPYDPPTPGPARHQGVALLYRTTTAPQAPDEHGPAPGDSPAPVSAGVTAAADPAPDAGAGPLPGSGGPAASTGDVVAASARVSVLRQHPDVAADDVAALAGSELAALAAGRPDVRVLLSADLATAWPAHPVERVTVTPPGQPTTGLWWTLLDLLATDPGRPRPVLAADYDPDLRYLCLVEWAGGTADHPPPPSGR